MLISVPSINHSRILVKTNKSWLIFSSFLFFSVFFRHFWPSYNFDSYQIMSLSTRVGCCTVLSCNDPFSLVNEVHKLLRFWLAVSREIFRRWSVSQGHQVYAHVKRRQHALNSWYVPFKVRRAWSKMNTYSILDYWILKWFAVALCIHCICYIVYLVCIWMGIRSPSYKTERWCHNFWASL